jgi:peptidoglycan/LPS O-acetylase OafA/YrhL
VVYLGRISYGLYLYHVLVLNLFAWAIPGGGRVALARLVLVLPVAVAGSAASFELVEKRFLRRRPPHREAAAAPVAARAL